MKHSVMLFAAARDAAGCDRLTVAIAEDATVADLRQAVLQAAPNLARFGSSLWIAINGDYAADTDVIPGDAEIACFPPVSGG